MNAEAWIGIVVAVVGLVGVVIGSVITSRATLAQARQQQRWEHERIVRTKLEEIYQTTLDIKLLIAKRYGAPAKSSPEEIYREFLGLLDIMNKLALLIRFYAPPAVNEYNELRDAVQDFYATWIKIEESKRSRRTDTGVTLATGTGTDAKVDKTINTIRELSDEILSQVVGVARKMSELSAQ